MAAPKKPSTKSASKKTTTSPKPENGGKSNDPLNEILDTLKAFQPFTLIAIGLAIILLVFLIFEDLRVAGILNIILTAAAGYLFWSQGDQTDGIEQKVCRWGLLVIAVMFLYRDILISQRLAEFIDKYGPLEKALS